MAEFVVTDPGLASRGAVRSGHLLGWQGAPDGRFAYPNPWRAPVAFAVHGFRAISSADCATYKGH